MGGAAALQAAAGGALTEHTHGAFWREPTEHAFLMEGFGSPCSNMHARIGMVGSMPQGHGCAGAWPKVGTLLCRCSAMWQLAVLHKHDGDPHAPQRCVATVVFLIFPSRIGLLGWSAWCDCQGHAALLMVAGGTRCCCNKPWSHAKGHVQVRCCFLALPGVGSGHQVCLALLPVHSFMAGIAAMR